MGLLAGVYNGLFKRTSTFALCIGVGVIGVSYQFQYTSFFQVYKRIIKCTIDNLISHFEIRSPNTRLIFQFERAFDAAADYIWESKNQGKLWKDIKHKYDAPAEEEQINTFKYRMTLQSTCRCTFSHLKCLLYRNCSSISTTLFQSNKYLSFQTNTRKIVIRCIRQKESDSEV